MALRGHLGPIRRVAITADGKDVLTASDDGGVQVGTLVERYAFIAVVLQGCPALFCCGAPHYTCCVHARPFELYAAILSPPPPIFRAAHPCIVADDSVFC